MEDDGWKVMEVVEISNQEEEREETDGRREGRENEREDV